MARKPREELVVITPKLRGAAWQTEVPAVLMVQEIPAVVRGLEKENQAKGKIKSLLLLLLSLAGSPWHWQN